MGMVFKKSWGVFYPQWSQSISELPTFIHLLEDNYPILSTLLRRLIFTWPSGTICNLPRFPRPFPSQVTGSRWKSPWPPEAPGPTPSICRPSGRANSPRRWKAGPLDQHPWWSPKREESWSEYVINILPVALHKAVAEVSKIWNLSERFVVGNENIQEID